MKLTLSKIPMMACGLLLLSTTAQAQAILPYPTPLSDTLTAPVLSAPPSINSNTTNPPKYELPNPDSQYLLIAPYGQSFPVTNYMLSELQGITLSINPFSGQLEIGGVPNNWTLIPVPGPADPYLEVFGLDPTLLHLWNSLNNLGGSPPPPIYPQNPFDSV